MRIIIITQDEPFYLAQNIEYLINILPKHSKIVGCVVNTPSPFGRRFSFFKKAIETYKIFGLKFFLYYSFKYLKNKFDKNKKLNNVLNKYDIPKIQLQNSINSPDSIKIIKKYKPDLLISILGNEIFREPLINLAPKGCLNLHSALLPKYRGLMPTFWVMKNNEQYTGVSVFFVDEGIDSGPILVQKKIKIEKDYTLQDLIMISKKIGMEAIAEAVELIEKNQVKLIENDDNKKTYYSFPTRKDIEEFLAAGKRFF